MRADEKNPKLGSWWPWVATLILIVSLVLVWKVCCPETPPPLAAEVDLSAACAGDRWIGVLNEKKLEGDTTSDGGGSTERRGDGEATSEETRRCPDPWQPLFLSSRTKVPLGLQRYCLFVGQDPRERLAVIDKKGRVYYDPLKSSDREPYERIGRDDFEKIGQDYFTRIDRDCRVVGPAAETLFPPQGLGDALQNRFLQEAGASSKQLLSEPVRLVIVDSVQDSTKPENEACPPQTKEGDLECSPHGWVLANLATDLLGGAAEITSRRALMRTYRVQPKGPTPNEVLLKIENNPKTGGLFGYWSEFGDAIWRALADWLAIPEPGRPKLILNLSVGWEGIYGTDVAVVRDPIAAVVCHGALVVAAAGNRRAGPPSLEKPILPAAWEQLPAPTDEQCQALLGEEPRSYAFNTTYKPLLFAVGGVQEGGLILSNAKPQATPRLVAFGDHAAPLDEESSPPVLRTLTGTSVATLVVSAAAAVQWDKTADLGSFDVMDELWKGAAEYAAGHPAEQLVDFCWEPKHNCPLPTTARRIFVKSPTFPLAGKPSDLPIRASLINTVKLNALSTFENVLDCEPQVLAYKEKPSQDKNLCPQRWPFDIAAQPWLGPQPGSNHNPDCRYTEGSPGTLVLEFDPCFRIEGMPTEIDDFTLVAGSVAYRLPIEPFRLGDPDLLCPLENDDRRQQVVLAGNPFEGLHPMYLAVTVNGRHATITPILQVLKED